MDGLPKVSFDLFVGVENAKWCHSNNIRHYFGSFLDPPPIYFYTITVLEAKII